MPQALIVACAAKECGITKPLPSAFTTETNASYMPPLQFAAVPQVA